MLMMEGKGLVEDLFIEPHRINWLEALFVQLLDKSRLVLEGHGDALIHI